MVKQWTASTLLLACAVLAAAQDAGGSAFSKASNESLLWGAYRPNLYFGLRPRIPKSILTGLLWARVEDYTSVQNDVRYTCEQHAGMAGYGWDAYDPRTGGVQVVHDKGNGIDIETSFVKFDNGKGGWGARIKGTPRKDAQPGEGSTGDGPEKMKTAVWFTVSAEGLGSVEAEESDGAEAHGYAGDVVLNGQAQGLGEFKITVTEPKSNSHPLHNHPSYQAKPLDHTFVHSAQVPEEALWQAKGKCLPRIRSSGMLILTEHPNSNSLQFHEDVDRCLHRRIYSREDAASVADLHHPEQTWSREHASCTESV